MRCVLNRTAMLHQAASLRVGDPKRRALLAALVGATPTTKLAINEETEHFIEWVLASQGPMNPDAVTRFIEAKTGMEPKAPEEKAPAKRGPLAVGETVLVDKTKNTNTLNSDACEAYHGRIGTVESINADGMTIAMYRGDSVRPSRDLSGDKQFFAGFTSGKDTGLYRWTWKSDFIESTEGKQVLFELVYKRAGQTIDTRRIEVIQDYVDRGNQQGENRSNVYYSGYIAKFAYNKQGEMYFSMGMQQRDTPTTINPTKGELLYIGVMGKRPSGWKQDAMERGIGGAARMAAKKKTKTRDKDDAIEIDAGRPQELKKLPQPLTLESQGNENTYFRDSDGQRYFVKSKDSEFMKQLKSAKLRK